MGGVDCAVPHFSVSTVVVALSPRTVDLVMQNAWLLYGKTPASTGPPCFPSKGSSSLPDAQ